VRLGDLVELFADRIPLHIAARSWRFHNGAAAHQEREMAGPIRMRRAALLMELSPYRCDWTPRRQKGVVLKDSAVMVPVGRPCEVCGALYIAQPLTRVCGRVCGGVAAQMKRSRGARGRFAAEAVVA